MKTKLDTETHGIRPKLHSQIVIAPNSFLKNKKQSTLSSTRAETPKTSPGAEQRRRPVQAGSDYCGAASLKRVLTSGTCPGQPHRRFVALPSCSTAVLFSQPCCITIEPFALNKVSFFKNTKSKK